jgi:hypothetical protein
MAEVLAEFAKRLLGGDGRAFRAQVVGAPMPDGRWEGWIEFIPVDGGPPLRTPRETTQPNHRDAVYWASGLTAVYFEGALDRALRPEGHPLPVSPPAPRFDGPAPTGVRPAAMPEPVTDAVLDPFAVYEHGEVMLHKKLRALDDWHLVNIIIAHELSVEPRTTLGQLSPSSLIEIIVGAVRRRAGHS